MAILADTNVLLRSLYPDHPHYSAAEKALAVLRLRREVLCVAPQNLVEFWAVATRPRNENGLGMSPARAATEIVTLRRFFRLLPWTLDVLEAWQQMVVDLRISGKQTHDTHLVAIMQVHGITDILTFNVPDFRRFPGVSVLDPAQF
jgi:predicted nucleic acid-binding protein